ncbi:hypothetical protein LINPERHAP1_LOCUS38748 [Linum perenne]
MCRSRMFTIRLIMSRIT